MEISQYAPVFIPTLNRYEHFKRCIESLLLCTHSEKTELYIALDYPLKEEHWEGYNKIANYIETVKGFKNIIVKKRMGNYGPVKNFFEGQKEVFEKYDRIIFTEDDNIFSPNFLDYLNKGLTKFENNKEISSICGYMYPINMKGYNRNYFFYKTFSAWGYGTWKNRTHLLYYSHSELVSIMKKINEIKSIYLVAQKKIFSILNAIIKNKPLYGDGVISLENIKHDMYSVFPTISKVRNNGHDGSGYHCGNMNSDIYSFQDIDNSKLFFYDDFVPIRNKIISNKLRPFFRMNTKRKMLFIIMYIKFILKITKQ